MDIKREDTRKFMQGDRCYGCQQVRPLKNRWAADLCEYCILVVQTKFAHMLSVCGWCERRVLSPETHPCAESKSVDWLDLLAKLP